MKNPIITRVIPVLLLATTAFAQGEPKQDVVIRRRFETGGPHFNVQFARADSPGPAEMEKVAYLGVETMPVDPTVAAQLGLQRGTGVVVRRVAEGSPATGLLQPHDVLTKIDDQILVNMQQLTVLVRNHKAGDEVKLTVVRAGKESVLRAKLGEREVPKLAEAMPPFMHLMDDDDADIMTFHQGMAGMPGLAGPEAGDVMRRIGSEHRNWFAQPRVHVFKRHGGEGPTILDLPSGNFVFSDDQGSVEVNSTEGKRALTVKDKKGTVTFSGPINTPEEREKLPAEVKSRLDVIGGAELGDDADEIKVETKVLRPGIKTRTELPPPLPAHPEPGMRSL
ncbi:MAG TPA: PDZ domain-containing protein [Lacunisphaera sp.]